MMFRLPTVIVCLAVAFSACKTDPQVTAKNHLERGNKQLERRQFPEAIIEFRRAVQADPRLGEARLKLAHAYASTGDGPNALREVRARCRPAPGRHRSSGEGRQFHARGRPLRRCPRAGQPHAGSRCQECRRADPAGQRPGRPEGPRWRRFGVRRSRRDGSQPLDYVSGLGQVQLEAGKKAEAEAAFRKAIEIDPKSPGAHLSLANFLWSTGDKAGAEQAIKHALQLDPKNHIANRSIAMYYMVSNRAAEAEPHRKPSPRRSRDRNQSIFSRSTTSDWAGPMMHGRRWRRCSPTTTRSSARRFASPGSR